MPLWTKHCYFLIDMLEMYFEETWSQPDKVIMIAGEQAAIVSFTDPEGSYFSLHL